MPSHPSLRKLVKKFVGRDDVSLSVDEAKTAKELYPEDYAEYLRQRKAYTSEWKSVASSLCKKFLPYETLYQRLAAAGFDNVITAGFTGLIGPDLKLYTKDQELIDGVPSVSFYPSVVMNPAYGKEGADQWVFRGIKADGTKGGYFYTTAFKHAQHIDKHTKVRTLDVPAIRKKWLPKVKRFDIEEVTCVTATVLEMLWQFTARVGTVGNATFGISTLLVKHVTITPKGIVIKYKGKDSVATTHKLLPSVLEHRPLIKNIIALVDGKTGANPLFTVVRDGVHKRILPATVNKYWRMCGAPEDVGVHKIRTWRGTNAFYEIITAALQNKRPKTLAEARALFKRAAEQVGAMLNHVRSTAAGDKVTGITALNSYIDADIQVMYWQELGYELPPKLAKYAMAHNA